MRFGNTELSRSETIGFFFIILIGLIGGIIPAIFVWGVLSEIGFWPVVFLAAAFGIGYWAHWWRSLSPEERAARRIESRRYDDDPYA